MNYRTVKDITILWGLPGCGKSTYAKCFKRDKSIIDFDKLSKNVTKPKALKALGDAVVNAVHCNNEIIIDGLFTTNAQVRELIDSLKIALSQWTTLVFEIVWWAENREACLANDQYRFNTGERTQTANTSIQNMAFEKPDVRILSEINNRRLFKRKTEQVSPAMIWAAGLNNVIEMKLVSESWCMGGTYGNCYGDHGSVEASPQPEFDIFEDLLLKVCPNISYLVYKKIARECCAIETEYDSDYYGGGTTRGKHVCDLEKLYTILQEMKII